MAERVASLSAYAGRLYSLVDDDAMRRIGKKAGLAGKDAAFDAARDRLGLDRAMSNFKSGRVRLGARYEQGPVATQVVIDHRPGGLWILAESGRKREGTIYPRNGRRKGTGTRPGRSVNTPFGPRASSSFGRSRGTGLLRKAAALERAAIPEAAFKQLQAEIRAVVGQGVSLAKFLM